MEGAIGLEEREFQVRLAMLEADVQIHLAAAFGFLAALAGVILVDEQIFYSLPADQSVTKWVLFGVILTTSVGCACIFYFFTRKALAKRKEMEELIPPPTPPPTEK